MMEKDNQAYLAQPPTLKTKIRHAFYGAKYFIQIRCHSIKWRILHLTKLATPYSKLMCKLNLYGFYPDGRCQWCGVDHEVD